MSMVYINDTETQKLVKGIVDGMGIETMKAYVSAAAKDWIRNTGSSSHTYRALPEVIQNVIREAIREMADQAIRELKPEIMTKLKGRIQEMSADELLKLVRQVN